jgi:hypothetical protein
MKSSTIGVAIPSSSSSGSSLFSQNLPNCRAPPGFEKELKMWFPVILASQLMIMKERKVSRECELGPDLLLMRSS